MCILALALGCHPSFPFVCAHNRDEVRSRASGETCLEPDTRLICGRDLEAGGMVMGLHSEKGHFAALTNCRTKHKRDLAQKASRGRLVEHLVTHGPGCAEEFLAAHQLDGFHVVFGNVFCAKPKFRRAWCCPEESGTGEFVAWRTGVEDLSDGVFVVSNENCNDHGGSWPKCRWLRDEVAAFFRSLPVSPPPSATRVHAGLADIMGRFDLPSVVPPAVLPRLFPPEKEVLLHTGPFAPWRPEFAEFGTVSQTIVVDDRTTSQFHYSHRGTNLIFAEDDAKSPRCAPWATISIPRPLAPVACCAVGTTIEAMGS
eukprot:CAMPEP_0117473828 /NCGR_PEP_ID=MMETSP0784-20121206/8971_1 /TAXON_ID=39447 /ORGANISM="" /LENGTH=312 /DNA_ID=CAMNT_0005268037 /DNA_START=39 /DNA_END=974 /DNA_ORIENTATION=-